MKLPSIHQILTDSGRTLRRFPFVIACALLGTLSAVMLIEFEGPAQPTIYYNFLFGAIPGFPLFFMIALIAEKRKWGMSTSFAVQAIGVLALAAYAWSVPSDLMEAPAIHVLRLVAITLGLCLLATVAPFAGRGETNGFWQYNKSLLLRILTSALYVIVLYAGLALALAALNQLFGMDIPGKRYAELWIIINGLFTTLFFLGGIPEQLDALETSIDYPKGIRIFAQYILFPLVIVYLVILYAYMGKILISWDWPKGWVSRLILGFSTAGILTHLLCYPIRDQLENSWMKKFSKWFFITLIPLVVMYFFAVSLRISEYGITEGRYIAITVGAWLSLIILYFTFSKGKNIKIIPGSLGMIALMISFGPWGMFGVSESSQVKRLKKLLQQTSILVDGAIHPATKPLPFNDTKEISSILGYLHEVHGYKSIQLWFSENLKAESSGSAQKYKDPSLVAKMMGVEYVRVWMGTATNEYNLRADAEQTMNISGYDRLWRTQIFSSGGIRKDAAGNDFGCRASTGLDTLMLASLTDGKEKDSLQVDMNAFTVKLLEEYKNTNAANIPPERMSITRSTDRMRVKVFVHHIYARSQDNTLKLTTYEVTVLYSLTPDPFQ